MRRRALHDDEWERIKDFLPGRGMLVVLQSNNRLFIDAVLYRDGVESLARSARSVSGTGRWSASD